MMAGTYLRTISRRNRDGSQVSYLQLADGARHPESGNANARVIHSFGREDQLDRDALARLVRSIASHVGPDVQLELTGSGGGGDGELRFVGSRRFGVVHTAQEPECDRSGGVSPVRKGRLHHAVVRAHPGL